jgi:hypothetical protein
MGSNRTTLFLSEEQSFQHMEWVNVCFLHLHAAAAASNITSVSISNMLSVPVSVCVRHYVSRCWRVLLCAHVRKWRAKRRAQAPGPELNPVAEQI